jgi:hypothetical protein
MAFTAFFMPAFVVGERGFGATGSRVCGSVCFAGLATQLLDALVDRREIIGGAGSGHIASWNYAGAGAVAASYVSGLLDYIVLKRPETGKSSA